MNQVPSNTQPYAAPADFHALLSFSGLSPEVFRALSPEAVEEYRRALEARRLRAVEKGDANHA